MTTHEIRGFVSKNILTISVQVVGLLVVILNLWLSSRIAPFSERVSGVENRVAAIEDRNKAVDPLIPRYIATEQREIRSAEDIKEVKETTIRIEGKLDGMILRDRVVGR